MDYPSHVNLSKSTRAKLVEVLNEQLSRSVDLFTQVKQAHWNLKGRDFYSQHLLLDEVAKHLRHHSDDMAERAATLGGYAEGTARMVAQRSDLPEYDRQAVDGMQHIRLVVERLARYCAGLREGIERCEELEDPSTADLLTTLLNEGEKDMWFLESHLHGSERGSKSPDRGSSPKGEHPAH